MIFQDLWRYLTVRALPTTPSSGSMAEYLKRLDAALSSRAAAADWTSQRAAYLDAALATRAAAADWTSERAARLDAALSALAAGADWTSERAAKLDAMGATTKHQTVRPSLADGISFGNPPSFPNYSGWAQVIAANSITAEFQVVEILAFPTTNPVSTRSFFLSSYQIQVGVGGAGAEVPKAEAAFNSMIVTDTVTFMGSVPDRAVLVPPLVVPANSRVALRCSRDADVPMTLTVKVAILP